MQLPPIALQFRNQYIYSILASILHVARNPSFSWQQEVIALQELRGLRKGNGLA